MDIVSQLFYPSWLNAVRDEGRRKADDPGCNQDQRRHAVSYGPDWRLAFAPMALVAAMVLAGVFFSTST
jgi:hypothetical protein